MAELIAEDLACGQGAQTLLKGVSFTVRSEDFLCLLGPNGAGKTTLFKTLLRLIKPKAGRVLLDGEDTATFTPERFATHIGYVPQAHMPPFPYRVLDVVIMGRTSRHGMLGAPSRTDARLAEEALQSLGIAYLRDALVTEISGGERQLVLIARALAQSPAILIMDEPTSNLDFGNQITVLDQVSQLAQEGMGIIMTTHDPNHALFHATSVATIGRQGEFAVGAPEAVITEEYLRATYRVSPQVAAATLDGKQTNVFLPVAKQSSVAWLRKLTVTATLALVATFGGILSKANAESAPARTVTDMIGRKVELPPNITRIACLEVLCYQRMLTLGSADRVVTMTMTAAPWMVATNPRVEAIQKIPAEPNFEDLLVKQVDVAFFAYNADRTMKKLESLGIPGLVSQPVGRTARTVKDFIADTKRSMQLFGQVLGGEAERRAEAWCDYLDERIRFVTGRLSGLPAERRLKMYYLRGPEALNTQGVGSNTFWYSEMAGADMVVKSLSLAGKGSVSMEDMVRWNPDIILVGRQYSLDLVLKDERFAEIAAVKHGRVYSSPEGVFYWDGGPESVLLMLFVAKLLYPDRFADLDVASEVKRYYARFYGYQLSNNEVALLLKGQSPDGRRVNPVNN